MQGGWVVLAPAVRFAAPGSALQQGAWQDKAGLGQGSGEFGLAAPLGRGGTVHHRTSFAAVRAVAGCSLTCSVGRGVANRVSYSKRL